MVQTMKLMQKKKISGAINSGCLFLITLPLTGIGIFALSLVISTLWDWYHVKQWIETPAYILETGLEIHETSTNREKRTKTYMVTAHYRYVFNGNTYENFKISVDMAGYDSSRSFHYKVYNELNAYRGKDKPFRCYVNPNNPTEAVLYRTARWNLLGFFMIFVMAFGGIGLSLLIGILYSITRQETGDDPSELAKKHPGQPWLHRADWKSKQICSNNSIDLFMVTLSSIMWNILSLPTWIMIYGIIEENNTSALWIMLFPLVGVLLILVMIYRFLRQRKFGNVILELDSVPCVPGIGLHGKIRIPIAFNVHQGIALTLKGTNKVATKLEKNKVKYHSHIFWTSVQVSHDGSLSSDKTYITVPVHFEIPSGVRVTDDNPNDTVFWLLKAECELPGINFSEEFDIPVFHLREQQEPGEYSFATSFS